MKNRRKIEPICVIRLNDPFVGNNLEKKRKKRKNLFSAIEVDETAMIETGSRRQICGRLHLFSAQPDNSVVSDVIASLKLLAEYDKFYGWN